MIPGALLWQALRLGEWGRGARDCVPRLAFGSPNPRPAPKAPRSQSTLPPEIAGRAPKLHKTSSWRPGREQAELAYKQGRSVLY